MSQPLSHRDGAHPLRTVRRLSLRALLNYRKEGRQVLGSSEPQTRRLARCRCNRYGPSGSCGRSKEPSVSNRNEQWPFRTTSAYPQEGVVGQRPSRRCFQWRPWSVASADHSQECLPELERVPGAMEQLAVALATRKCLRCRQPPRPTPGCRG